MHIKPKKFFGQHFLTDQYTLTTITEAIKKEASSADLIIEIGPGKGALTEHLVENIDNNKLVLIEIDKDMGNILKKRFPKLELIVEDFLKVDFSKFSEKKIMVVGNFPYNISSQILFKILENREQVFKVVCMLQKEVGERILSAPCSKKYGILSILLGIYYDSKYTLEVPPSAFVPQPKVYSIVLELSRNTRPNLNEDHEKKIIEVVKTAFSQRRKILKNVLKSIIDDENIMTKYGNKRAEELSIDDYFQIADSIYN